MIKIKRKGANGSGDRVRWNALKEKYFALILEGRPVTLEEFAKQEGINYGTLRNRASKGKWSEEAQARLERQEKLVTEKMVERSAAAIDAVRDRLAADEAEVRQRHVRIARNLQAKAYARIRDVATENISVRDAIELLKVGMSEERKGLGLPDEYTVSDHQHNVVVSKAQEAFQNRIAVNSTVRTAVAKALHLIDAKLIGSKDASTDK